jgi:APA family basic amino acid/polyamine antiporter
LTVATLLYVLMSLCICLMVPYQQIDVDAPFAAAFLTNGMPWAARVVSLGAVMGAQGEAGHGLGVWGFTAR